MRIVTWLRRKILRKFFPPRMAAAREAYNAWSHDYDNQPGNLMLSLDEQLFHSLIGKVNVENKVIVDVGCGTGRHWPTLLAAEPAKITGFDVSEGMLAILKEKFPGAETHIPDGNVLLVKNESTDIVISTLTIAHIQRIDEALAEWVRILRPGGSLLITDYHPTALAGGGKRTFNSGGETIVIRNYVHPVQQLAQLAKQFGLNIIDLIEIKIDDSMRRWYEEQNSIALFEQFKGMPIIFGVLLEKPHDPS